MAVDWTQLPRELLESISGKLTIYADYLRFRAVCDSWRSSVLNTPRNLPPQLPWLMLPQVQSNPSHRAFFDLSTRKLHNLELLEATSHSKRCCGSSHGWLIVLDDSPAVLLLNPLTPSRLHLPPLSAFPNVVSFNYSEVGKEYALRGVSGEIYRRSLREMRNSFIKKVVLSSAPLKNKNFIALAILNHSNILVYCKNGDQSWSFIHVARFFCEDVIYYNDLFYAVDKNGAIAVCDVNGSSPTVSVIRPPLQLGGDMQYLVNSGDDELLLVTRYVDLQYDDTDPYVPSEFYKTVGFEVFRMNWGEPRWERVTSLGDRMFFIGENMSISFLAYDFRACLGNCIYFTDDCEFYDGAFGDYDLGIFKLWDGSIEPLPCYQRNPHSQTHWPPIWVTPNPC
ncbi:F-box protein SKIP23-like [Corylus avellana]|uniref:F-box protein SKIP23-like n=1 Tax=Corylus avellana TaxID=13451 RepID=UPI00286C8F63|nr:F-box protein SKIP23-like [Corylus avellana]